MLTTLTLPLVPVPTIAVMVESSTIVKLVALVPPKLTLLAYKNPEPVIVTMVPFDAVVGLKLLTVAAAIKVNPARVPVPPGVVTLTFPLAPLPT